MPQIGRYFNCLLNVHSRYCFLVFAALMCRIRTGGFDANGITSAKKAEQPKPAIARPRGQQARRMVKITQLYEGVWFAVLRLQDNAWICRYVRDTFCDFLTFY